MVVFAMVDIADLLELDSLVDGAERTSTQEALFEELCSGGEVARVLLVTEVAGLLGGIFEGERCSVDLGCKRTASIGVDDCW